LLPSAAWLRASRATAQRDQLPEFAQQFDDLRSVKRKHG
jgi:hypothetical protein